MRRRTGTIQRRPTGFRIRYTDLNGKRHSETFATRDEAETELSKRVAKVNEGEPVTSKPTTVRFGELAADVIIDYKLNKFRSVDDLEARLRLHILPVFENQKAAQITTAKLKSYIVDRRNEGASIGTVSRELQAIKHIFKLAIQGRKLVNMPHVPMLREDNVRSGFFTREEVERLCRHLKKPLDSFVKFAFLTGWRLEEIRDLKWSNVDFEKNEIRIDAGKSKNREPRVMKMCAELRDSLKALLPAERTERAARPDSLVNVVRMPTGAQYVFVKNGRPIGEFRKTWKRANHLAGLPCVYDSKGNVIRAVRHFHDLRRSAAREFAAQGIPQHIIMKIMGHRTASMFLRYAIVGESDLEVAVEKLDHRGDSSKERTS
jgi:integrase